MLELDETSVTLVWEKPGIRVVSGGAGGAGEVTHGAAEVGVAT